MADLKVNYEGMNSTADKMAKAEEELTSLISNLTSAAQVLGDDNQGQFYQAFVNAWNETKPQLENLRTIVGEFAPKLRNAVDIIKGTDGSIKF